MEKIEITHYCGHKFQWSVPDYGIKFNLESYKYYLEGLLCLDCILKKYNITIN